jgi:hypothetical protein
MPNPNFVCTICSQTFTRKWRGTVHRENTHAGAGDIVRLIDYMIGRTNGQYLPADPSLYRRRRRMGNISNDPHDNNPFRSQTSSCEMSNSSGRENNNAKWTFNKKYIDQGRDTQPSGASLALDRNQKQYHMSDNRPFSDSMHQPNEAIIKMAEIKKLLSKHLPPEKIQDILSCACNYCITIGDYSPLNITLEEARKKVEFREASDYLNNSYRL